MGMGIPRGTKSFGGCFCPVATYSLLSAFYHGGELFWHIMPLPRFSAQSHKANPPWKEHSARVS